MKSTLVCILILFVGHNFAQQIYITPLIGIKADVGKGTLPNGQYGDFNNKFDYKTYPVSSRGLSPLLIGVLVEIKKNKNFAAVGLILGDGANSALSLGFKTQNVINNKTYSGYRKDYQFVGVNVLKVPISYKRIVYNFKDKSHSDVPKKSCINFKTGLNLLYIRPSINPSSIVSFGKSVMESGDTVELVGGPVNLNKKWSISIDLGFDVDIYIKNKRRITASLYFEQGTRKLSLSQFDIFINDAYTSSYASYSRGSAINLKLLFPINIYNKNNISKN